MSPIPAHSPYQAGDRVQLHGYPGYDNGHKRTGFRGVVRGYLGATLLTGVTDTGENWAEYWGALWPEQHDVKHATDNYRCTCCTRPAPAQASLFDAIAQGAS